MRILVFNGGSSSLSFKVYSTCGNQIESVPLIGKAHRVGVTGSEPSFIEFKQGGTSEKLVVPLESHRQAASHILRHLRDRSIPVDAIGHRFVHGGRSFATSALIDEATMARLEGCLALAPIHNPLALDVIYECREVFPELPGYVTFDTAFHSSIPRHVYTYALPESVRRRYGFRKFGFHGLSYTYVSRVAARHLGWENGKGRMVACHLGTGGSSVAAIQDGKSLDTSMGYSPLAGLVMSTRCGDVDPMLLVYLMTACDIRPEDLEGMLNKKSGLIGLSGFSSDLRDILGRIHEDDEERAALAFSMYCHRLRKYIGGYTAALGGLDALVFTDDIGIQNADVRERICRDMQWAGIDLDPEANRAVSAATIHTITKPSSRVPVLTVPTDEEIVIAWEGMHLLAEVVTA